MQAAPRLMLLALTELRQAGLVFCTDTHRSGQWCHEKAVCHQVLQQMVPDRRLAMPRQVARLLLPWVVQGLVPVLTLAVVLGP